MPQLLVHIAHEVMKMAAPAFWQRQAVIEQVHQHGLAATDATVQVYAARALRHRDSVRQWRSPRGPQDPARPAPRARPRARYRARPPGDRAPRPGSPGAAPAAPRARPARSTRGAAEHAPGAGRPAWRESPPG